MNYILFDDNSRDNLLPLTFTRPISEIRIGILTITEKWEKMLHSKVSFLTQDYLKEKFPVRTEAENCLVNGSILPDEALVKAIENLESGKILMANNSCVALKLEKDDVAAFNYGNIEKNEQVLYEGEILKINYPWEIFKNNGVAIRSDFQLLTAGRKSQELPKNNNYKCSENIFLEEGAKISFSTINAESGPVYIGKDAEIMEGCVIRGPFALCDHSGTKMAAKIYGPTTIGPHSKAGGEINNSVIFGYSNKGHDGFLGNAVLGEWCNIGADSNNSNLKNNYAEVKLWNYPKKGFVKTGLQFCGLIMGDHSKCGINTMFNTGTVAGVSANIFGSGFQRNFIPSFSWGGPGKMEVYGFKKAIETGKLVMDRRGIDLGETDIQILEHVFESTQEYRKFL